MTFPFRAPDLELTVPDGFDDRSAVELCEPFRAGGVARRFMVFRLARIEQETLRDLVDRNVAAIAEKKPDVVFERTSEVVLAGRRALQVELSWLPPEGPRRVAQRLTFVEHGGECLVFNELRAFDDDEGASLLDRILSTVVLRDPAAPAEIGSSVAPPPYVPAAAPPDAAQPVQGWGPGSGRRRS